MSGVTLANEGGLTLWVDLDALTEILVDADAKYADTLEEMETYPAIWGEEIDECRDIINAKRATIGEVVDFIRNKEDAE